MHLFHFDAFSHAFGRRMCRKCRSTINKWNKQILMSKLEDVYVKHGL